MNFDEKTYAAWLASAEIPYDTLIPLLHRMKTAERVFNEFKDPESPAHVLIPDSFLHRQQES